MSLITQTEPDQFYYADGKKIPLAPSSHFVAVRTDADNGTMAGRLSQSLSAFSTPSEVVALPQYNLAIVRVAAVPGAANASLPVDAINSFVRAQADVDLGPEVLEVAESPVVEGLIPVGEILVKFKSGVAQSARENLLREQNLEIRETNYPEPDAYLVNARNAAETVTLANTLHESDLVEYAHPNFVRLSPRLEAFGNGSTVIAADALEAMSETPSIPLSTMTGTSEGQPTPTAPPSDPNYAAQWGLRKIKAPEAFDISMGSPNIAVAVIDEGCDLGHEDISYKLPGYDAVYRTDNPSPLPADGHGTSCAGIVAAKANNARGGAGVAPKCKILPVRIAYGAGSGWVTSDAIIADGIRKAVERGADVLSNSWGGGSPSSAITSAFQYAQTSGRGGKGCPIAIATGNNDVRGVSYPAILSPTIPGLMAVGASNQWDQRKSRTSQDGENWWGSQYGPEVDVVAPGVQIFTTDITGTAGYTSGNYVPNFNGTSSATPHVAGLMGLILSVDPDLRSWEVEDIIKLAADDLGPAGRDEEFGFGRINCRRALEAASRLWYEITVGLEFLGAGKECYMRMNVRMYNPGINTVRLNGLTLSSYGTDGRVIDSFNYQPNPGNVMAPRAGQDVKFNNVLLKANGNQSGWSYSWNINWGYTFWRPSAPSFPFSAEPLTEAKGQTVTGSTQGKASKASAGHSTNNQVALLDGNMQNLSADELIIDLKSKTLRIALG